ncbi:MAG: PDZ domain-containing protein [Gammaproteobacteria bacterium]
MVKALLLVAAGLGVGLAAAWWLQSENGAPAVARIAPGTRANTDSASGVGDARLTELEATLTAEVAQRAALEARVTALSDELATLRTRPSANPRESAQRDGVPPPPADSGPPPFGRGGPFRRDAQGSQADALVAAGFAPDRAAWIEHRTSELRMQALQAQYDAQREGKPFNPGQGFGGDNTLRSELGDGDYERYLKATGRPTSVGVQGVLASSPGERAGLKPGDEVVAYDGKRVFDLRELNTLTFEGTAGESVTVSVRRDGQTVHLTMPRGPIGVVGGGFRGR